MSINALAKLDKATQMLAEAKTLDEVKHIRDIAEAARTYARAAHLGLEAYNHAAEIKVRAERKAGEFLKQLERGKGGGDKKSKNHSALIGMGDFSPYREVLEELEIPHTTSHRWQAMAEMPEKVFESVLENLRGEKPITTSGLLKQIKRKRRRADIDNQRQAIAQGEIEQVAGLFDVISIDPPWPYGTEYDPDGRRAANPYPEMSLEEIAALELPASDNCILFLWTTHQFMRYSFPLLDGWGFREVAIITWEKSRMGLGSWLRSQTEFCIMAVKGKPQVLLTNQTTILHGQQREHSRKPDEFYALVDSLCTGFKLDYFSREPRPGWAQIGNDMEKFNG